MREASHIASRTDGRLDRVEVRLQRSASARASGDRGMHILATLRHASAEEVAAHGTARGMHLRALSSYAEASIGTDSLVIGYTHLQPSKIPAAVQDLARILKDAR